MQTQPMKFEEIEATPPVIEDIRARYEALREQLNQATDADGVDEVFTAWNALRAELRTWMSLTHLRFSQDTEDEARKKAREYSDEISPKLTDLEVDMKRALLASEHRPALEERHGRHLFALWEADAESFRPEIEEETVRLNKLKARYVELRSSARIELDGETYNLSEIARFTSASDRDLRHRAQQARWGWVGGVAEELDAIYDEMVKLRHQAAQKLGYDDFVGLGYKRMHRVDYDRDDVARFRAEVQRVVVPLAQKLREQQAERLGVDRLMAWDLPVHDTSGNPAPHGDHDWMIERAQSMFDELGHGMGEFFRTMHTRHYLDLKSRKGKSGGGFCTAFPTVGMPFVFANFNDTKHDVEVFTHEMGHAFQNWKSQHHEVIDYHWPTYESAEIHSMSLEFLTWPHMEKFFEEDADRFRQIHLIESLLFLPYGVAVDHFQHMVYANPEATPAERKQMWRELEARYLPWIDWGDLEHPASGGRWQLQSHIYGAPFYYIDYTLALSCAMQFWLRAEEDFDAAMQDYVTLCERGGEAPFQELVRSAGVTSPFQPGCLEDVVARAHAQLLG